jgi:hypothetical protein
MGEETARLRAEIDQTRDDLTRDVDLLAEKTSPSRIVERRVERTKRGLAGLKDKVMGTSGSDDDDERHGYGYYGDSRSGDSQGGVTGNVRSAVSSGTTTATSAAISPPRRPTAASPPASAGRVKTRWATRSTSTSPSSRTSVRSATSR